MNPLITLDDVRDKPIKAADWRLNLVALERRGTDEEPVLFLYSAERWYSSPAVEIQLAVAPLVVLPRHNAPSRTLRVRIRFFRTSAGTEIGASYLLILLANWG